MRSKTSLLRIGRLFSTNTRVTSTGKEIISPVIGLTDDQAEFYNLARNFADNEMRPYASKYQHQHEHVVHSIYHICIVFICFFQFDQHYIPLID